VKSFFSPAKINLRLLVKGRRPDGYHEIETLLQAIDIFDTLIFTPLPKGIEVYPDTNEVPSGEGNIVWRAAAALLKMAGCRQGVRVEIKKRIPVAAGLGGGSSNAATTLLALNKIFDLDIPKGDLLSLGASLGADVPFFLFGKTAWARGIGELLEEASDIPIFNYLIINPGFPLSTREVYEGLKIGLTNKINKHSAPTPLGADCKTAELLVNDLESVSFAMNPQIKELKKLILTNGAQGALMSGSGPSVFGLFPSIAAAHTAASKIAMARGWRAFIATGLNKW